MACSRASRSFAVDGKSLREVDVTVILGRTGPVQELPTQIGHSIWQQLALHRPLAHLRFPDVPRNGRAEPVAITPNFQQKRAHSA
jgi:hypothetical protein